jgi:hypothetical protein
LWRAGYLEPMGIDAVDDGIRSLTREILEKSLGSLVAERPKAPLNARSIHSYNPGSNGVAVSIVNKSPKQDDLNEAKRIAERMLKVPPDPRKKQDSPKGEKGKAPQPMKRTAGKGRARVGKSRN